MEALGSFRNPPRLAVSCSTTKNPSTPCQCRTTHLEFYPYKAVHRRDSVGFMGYRGHECRSRFKVCISRVIPVIEDVNSWSNEHDSAARFPDQSKVIDVKTSKGGALNMAGRAVIKVVGVGGGGCNAINQMVSAKLPNVEFWAVNTDAQALNRSIAPNKLQIGKETTFGRGAGGRIEVGEEAAAESLAELSMALEGADLIFIAAGMGGGTGSGAGPVVARLAKAMGALTIGIVTQPFTFEGKRRATEAEKGTQSMKNASDTLVVVPNDKLLETVTTNTSIVDAFGLADDILRQGVQGISDIITVPGLVNVDFADVRAVMSNAGSAMLGIGVEGTGKDRAETVAQSAVMSPLLRHSVKPMGVVYNVTGGPELTLHEVNVVAEKIYSIAHPNANVIFGAVIDEKFKGMIRVTVIATGFEDVGSTEEGPYKTVDDDIYDWERSKRRQKVTEVPEFLKKKASRKV